VEKKTNEELNDPYSSPNTVRVTNSKRMRWAGNVASMRDRKGAYWASVEKPEGKRPLGRPRRRWKDNINPLNAELNPICHLLALLGGATIVDLSRLNAELNPICHLLALLGGATIIDVSRLRVKIDLQEVGWLHGLD
jgi:hypothetical protein